MTEFTRLLDLQLYSDDQFKLTVGDESRTGSLYYLEIDPKSPDESCSPENGLARLLGGWLTRLTVDYDEMLCYLPFDFADECTQWLACEKSGSLVNIVFGWAPVEGWAVSPCEFRSCADSLESFTPNEPLHIQTFYLPRLLSELRRLISRLNSLPRGRDDAELRPPQA